LSKDCDADEIPRAVRRLASGRAYITATLAELLAYDRMPASSKLPHEQLSDREYEVFKLLVSGRTLTEIANDLSLSIKTVSTHKARILEKMELTKTSDIYFYAMRHGLVDVSAGLPGSPASEPE
jgi:DNA-binding NarL/FixJ family response regulator